MDVAQDVICDARCGWTGIPLPSLGLLLLGLVVLHVVQRVVPPDVVSSIFLDQTHLPFGRLRGRGGSCLDVKLLHLRGDLVDGTAAPTQAHEYLLLRLLKILIVLVVMPIQGRGGIVLPPVQSESFRQAVASTVVDVVKARAVGRLGNPKIVLNVIIRIFGPGF